MQLEDIQQQWQQLDRKLDRSLALETELLRRVVLQPVKRRVNRLAIWSSLDMMFFVPVQVAVVMFLVDHLKDWRLVIPASVVAVGVALLVADSIRRLERVLKIDWCGPVVEIQSSLERLRVGKIRQFKWIILCAPLVGFCGLIVGLHWLFECLTSGRVNILDKLDSLWIVGNYLFGVLFVPLGYFAASVLAKKCHRYRWWQSVLDGISGTSLKSAVLEVERWESLQR